MSSHPGMMPHKPRFLHQLMISFGCVLTGWLAMSVFGIVHALTYASISPNWIVTPVTVSIYSLPLIVMVWLVLVAPVYCLVPRSSRFWWPQVCTIAFAAAGLLIMASLTGFSYTIPIYVSLWPLATVAGGVTGLCCSLMQRRLKRAMDRVEQIARASGE